MYLRLREPSRNHVVPCLVHGKLAQGNPQYFVGCFTQGIPHHSIVAGLPSGAGVPVGCSSSFRFFHPPTPSRLTIYVRVL